MKYEHKDFKDKTKEGIKKEVSSGLAKIAFYFFQTHGMPVDSFKDKMKEDLPTTADKLLFYMNFRNEHPEVFN